MGHSTPNAETDHKGGGPFLAQDYWAQPFNAPVGSMGIYRIALHTASAQLLEIATSDATKKDAFQQILRLLMGLTDAAEVLLFHRAASNELIPGQSIRQNWFQQNDKLQSRIADWCASACQSNAVEVHSELDPQLVAVCAPVIRPGRMSDGLCVILIGTNLAEHLMVLVHLVATYLSILHHRDSSRQAENDADDAAALVELLSRLNKCQRVRDACHELVNELNAYMGCRRVAIAYAHDRSTRCRLRAVSGIAEFDERSEFVRALEEVVQETTLLNSTSIWPPRDRHQGGLLAHRKLAEISDSPSVVAVPLRSPSRDLVGVLILLDADAFTSDERWMNLIEAAAPHIVIALEGIQRNERGPLTRLLCDLRSPTVKWRGQLSILLALLVTATLLTPVPYRVSGSAQLRATKRRVVAVPFQATLDRTIAKPGDVVKRGQLLAVLDGREIEWELAGLAADYDRTETERRVALAKHDVAAAQQAQLELQRLALRLQLYRHRAKNLEIRSPISGIVINGDLKKAEGVPLSTGQSLFEIGPLDRLTVDVAVPDEDICFVYPGAKLKLRLTADPTTVRTVSVVRIHPQAEVIEGQNIFRAEATIENRNGLLRPGMRGTSRIVGPRRQLGWILFHKPWQYLLYQLGW